MTHRPSEEIRTGGALGAAGRSRRDGYLFLSLMADGGIFEFEPIR
jgi:hypothetical protein